MSNVNRYVLIYQDGNSVRRSIDIDEKFFSNDVRLIGVQRFTQFDRGEASIEGAVPNGTYPFLQDESFKEVYGKLLTLVDATFQEGSQKTAFKDMTKEILSSWFDRNVGYTYKSSMQLGSNKE